MWTRFGLMISGTLLILLYQLNGEVLLFLNFLSPTLFQILEFLNAIAFVFIFLLILLPTLKSYRKREKPLFAVGVALIVISIAIWISPSAIGLPPNQAVLSTDVVDGKQANVSSDALVVGISLGDEYIAYPVDVLKRRLVLNDQVNLEPIVIAYCNSCKSPLAYKSRVDGERTLFDIVGTYKIDVVLQDINKKTWWDAGTGELLAGKAENPKLEQIPATIVQWGQWLEIAPNTKFAPLAN